MHESIEILIARCPEHGLPYHRLIHPDEAYHQTTENTVLYQECVGEAPDFEIFGRPICIIQT